eukprot:1056372-Amphidinium_carterae.1
MSCTPHQAMPVTAEAPSQRLLLWVAKPHDKYCVPASGSRSQMWTGARDWTRNALLRLACVGNASISEVLSSETR